MTNRNTRTAAVLVSVVLIMVGMAFASVPLYRVFCSATGFGGTTQRAEAAPKEMSKAVVTVRFNTETASDLGWKFAPEVNEVQVHPGEQKQVFFRATNQTNETVTATATYNVMPAKSGIYFDKIQCFCFNEQKLAPGEMKEMGVVFFVDPDLLKDPETQDVHSITLSYSMFRKPDSTPPSAAAIPAGPAKAVN
ncbi:MAG: cytochrome c oxidase assembly protein [Alphaproteobacteria bacterium]|nr:cytochrome c oxidase assembly protein [Alphaproteobacteria bacterium]